MLVNWGPLNEPCQHRHVVGVDYVLEVLQPVAGNDGRPAAADRGVVASTNSPSSIFSRAS